MSKSKGIKITRKRREYIEQLAKALADIAPSTSFRKGFCVQRVAEQLGLKKYWKKQSRKVDDIIHLLEGVFRNYSRKPKTLVLEIVRGGVQWMARKGERITQGHLDAIAEPMDKLNCPIRKELAAIKLPEPSRVRKPSQDLVAIFDRLDLHEALKDDVTKMFHDGHFNEAVRKALERFEKYIQKIINDHITIGKQLMAKAFNSKSPLIPINPMRTGNDRSEQEGFMHLTMGAMAGLRNLYSHGDEKQMGATDAIERLCFVSLLFKRVDRAVRDKP